LEGHLPDGEARVEAIHGILWKAPMEKMIRLVAFFVRRSRDPFQRFLRVLGPNNEWFFPCPPWKKVPVEMDDGVGWHQMTCPYKDFFEKEGVVTLTRAYCDLDKRIAALVQGHVELERDHRLADGDGWCDFLYHRRA